MPRICMQADFVAISFVRDANIIANVRSYIDAQVEGKHPGHHIDIVAKVEAYDSIAALPEIINAADVIMVARSDLGAQIPLEDVPAVQKEIVFRCRQVRNIFHSPLS
jgi:pyruvate kinase